ncbi:calcium:proton antiporter [Nocardioides sp. L-11A]|uniref:calcium:proton antiporter n=1 Tax=Nocardioides sp. L-11A TaxID=3043848 RepID=UPI00249AAD3B|nr:ionic transporter y4hA [Nocardioides sp. L-11A]
MSASTAGRLGWTVITPPVAAIVLAISWGTHPGPIASSLIGVALVGAVLAAVHHAEVVAHKVGEPFGSLLLAVAVTVIEVGLIVTLMVSGSGETATLARDTVFAAVMITVNGIVGISLVVGALRHHLAVFNSEGTGSALATVISLAGLTLVVPTFTTSEPGPIFTGQQLAFAAVASLALYGAFVFTQTVRHRDFFLPVGKGAPPAGTDPGDLDDDGHADPPTAREAWISLGLLGLALVTVVGLAKVESYAIEDAVNALGFPHATVGVVIALLVLAPESIAAVRAARRDRVQISLNLAYGSAMASIGLTIPAIAIASIWLDGPLELGLAPLQLALLLLTSVVAVLTVVPGRAKPLNGMVHLVLLAAFLFMTVAP